MTNLADTLAMLEANATENLANWRSDVPRKDDTAFINGHKVTAYASPCSGRNRFKNWATVRWYLNGKVVSRINLVKTLTENQS